jgi:hypothetical protein
MSHHEVLPTSAAELGKDFLIFDKDVFRWGLGRKGHNKSFDIYIHERLFYIDETPPVRVTSFILHQIPTSPWS